MKPSLMMPLVVWRWAGCGVWRTQESGGYSAAVREAADGSITAELLQGEKIVNCYDINSSTGCEIGFAARDAMGMLAVAAKDALHENLPGKGEYIYAFRFDDWGKGTMVGRSCNIVQRACYYLDGDAKRHAPEGNDFLGFDWIGSTCDSERAEEELLDHPLIAADRRGNSEAFDCHIADAIEAGMQIIKAYPKES